ncbi:MAG: hypothetical protein GWP38_04535 [Planctomycetia bacterium]|nr:hypothetical protein [Planctomycetia bacterium]
MNFEFYAEYSECSKYCLCDSGVEVDLLLFLGELKEAVSFQEVIPVSPSRSRNFGDQRKFDGFQAHRSHRSSS